MDFSEELQELALRIKKTVGFVQTEEATKQAFVIPFMKALGYDVYDPSEVVPEFTADVGTKKGEKVDYAIMQNRKPIILVECKRCGHQLDQVHSSQLYRYFSVTDARIAILTNGIVYQFFTDLEKQNTMDQRPFLEFDVLNFDETIIPEVKKLSKSSFDLNHIISSASELKYNREIKSILSGEFNDPSDEFTKFFVSKIYSGRMTQSVLTEFRGITKRSLQQFINGEINARLKSIIGKSDLSSNKQEVNQNPPVISVLDISGNMSKKQRVDEKIETTSDEINGFLAVVDALSGSVSKDRIIWKDVETYFVIMLDDDIRKPICRLHFNAAQKYISLFDDAEGKVDKVAIADVTDISNYTNKLIATVKRYNDILNN